ncbi:MAG: zinc ribbon domain-containing protein [Desulfocapsaceae bacterium]|nr:zinc ribbon domain-containing protein [Desulfocapsaceae bacterium]
MPVYEYECSACEKVFEVQQRIADQPLTHCPECKGEVKKLMSMSSFQLKGGGWYADGYSSASSCKERKTAAPAAAPCSAGGCCAGCSSSS